LNSSDHAEHAEIAITATDNQWSCVHPIRERWRAKRSHRSQVNVSISPSLYPVPFFSSVGEASSTVVSNQGGSWAYLAIRDNEFNQIPEVVQLRERWIVETLDDEALLWQVCGTLRHDNENELLKLADRLLVSDLEQQRGLGVTLTAFLSPEGGAEKMQTTASSDPLEISGRNLPFLVVDAANPLSLLAPVETVPR